MTVRCFVDSNVFVHADDRRAGAKRDRARRLLSRLDVVILGVEDVLVNPFRI